MPFYISLYGNLFFLVRLKTKTSCHTRKIIGRSLSKMSKKKKTKAYYAKLLAAFIFCRILHMSLEFPTNFAELDFAISLKICNN